MCKCYCLKWQWQSFTVYCSKMQAFEGLNVLWKKGIFLFSPVMESCLPSLDVQLQWSARRSHWGWEETPGYPQVEVPKGIRSGGDRYIRYGTLEIWVQSNSSGNLLWCSSWGNDVIVCLSSALTGFLPMSPALTGFLSIHMWSATSNRLSRVSDELCPGLPPSHHNAIQVKYSWSECKTCNNYI